MKVLFAALLSIFLSVSAQFFLKAGMTSSVAKQFSENSLSAKSIFELATNMQIVTGFALYGIGAIVWLSVLAQWDVSKAYPMVGLGFALTVAVGLLMGEQITLLRFVGVSMICIGVAMVGHS
ncbi:hypothetical protein [Denitromonas halophila]|uniref:EamA family transporter n=1 Tax=Denitromonas halophila TaxID=1629404 RepID=A0A557QD86_9RHOO|nr:hypothetical protein [Denitromonas halophila]TVO50860.1 hypothetical protein FHP91_20100 [Denitromonas halophila]